jgi:hypothetical protein
MRSILQFILITTLISCSADKTTIEESRVLNGLEFSDNPIANTANQKVSYKDNPALYYGVNYSDYDKTTISSKKLLKDLERTLNLYHQKTDGEDKIVESCSSQESCYSFNPYRYKEIKRYLFGTVYLDRVNNQYSVKDYYCGYQYINGDKVEGRFLDIGPGKLPDGQIINTEHLWPQSRFDDKKTQSRKHSDFDKKNDLHHLLPTDREVNSTRGAYFFGEVEESKTPLKCNGVLMGRASGEEYNSKDDSYFEPPEHIKGDIARALMYMSVKYEMFITDSEEAFIRKWHKEDPVDNHERRRNNIIHSHQGTRNPFIDYPHLESIIENF